MFDNLINTLSSIRYDLMTETGNFLESGQGDISNIELSFEGRKVSIPLMMPETNEATTRYLERLISVLREY